MTEKFSPEENALLSSYVSNTDRPVFTVQNLPEEVVAVLFAYYSRSRESLRRNLLTLINDRDINLGESQRPSHENRGTSLGFASEKAKQFHEKWVVGYGHASVAEHAVAHIAVEDISILASKIIEDNRLASFTEKSTRYVIFDPTRYYKAPELDTEFTTVYHETIRSLMQSYASLTPQAIEIFKKIIPRREGQSEAGFTAACRAKACDVLRYMLPAATFTNIGITINGRALEHLITKMLSHSLVESVELGREIKREAEKIIPTLLKYAEYSAYIDETERQFALLVPDLLGRENINPGAGNSVTLVKYDPDAEDLLIEAILYGYTNKSALEIRNHVRTLSQEKKEKVIEEYLARRGKWDQPLRALEHLYYTFDILIDFGAFRDIQRHRIATQTAQLNNDEHGYETPPEMAECGFEQQFKELMERSGAAYRKIAASFPYEAQYVLPLAYRKRVLFTWNLRELHHFISLRSGKQGHASYRKIAQQVYKEIERVHPLLARYIRVDMNDYSLARE